MKMNKDNKKTAIIMRGVPGSGKSTSARQIASGQDLDTACTNKITKVESYIIHDCVYYYGINSSDNISEARASIHSCDEHFCKTGTYKFNRFKLGTYHKRTLESFTNSLKLGIPTVICDNTNIRRAEFKKYVKAAEEFGYEVEFKVMDMITAEESFERNTHNVPLTSIESMIERLQE